MFFENKMSWKRHAEEMSNKANNRLKLLKRLSCITWGSLTNIILTTYETYVRPALDYGSALVDTASNIYSKLIDMTQNKSKAYHCSFHFNFWHGNSDWP